MVSKNIFRNPLRRRWIELESNLRLQFVKKALGSPSFAHEQVLHSRSVSALAQYLLIAEDLRHAARHLNRLIRPHERIELHRQVWFV